MKYKVEENVKTNIPHPASRRNTIHELEGITIRHGDHITYVTGTSIGGDWWRALELSAIRACGPKARSRFVARGAGIDRFAHGAHITVVTCTSTGGDWWRALELSAIRACGTKAGSKLYSPWSWN